MTDEKVKALLERMANECSVDMVLWDQFSNAVLALSGEVERLTDENDKLRGMPDDDRKSCIALMEMLAEARADRDAYRKTMEAMAEAPDAIAKLIADHAALQAERDKLAAEVERLTAWGNERHAAAREAMDTAYHLQYPPSPEMLENIAERIDCGGNCETAWREWDTNATGCTKSETDGCPFEEAANLRDFAKALRVQALAHHSAPVGEDEQIAEAWKDLAPGHRFGRRLTADAVETLERGTLLRFHSDDPWFDHSGDMPKYGEIVRFTGEVSHNFPLVGDHLEVQSLDGRTYPGGGWVFRLFQFVAPPTTPTSAPVEDVGALVEGDFNAECLLYLCGGAHGPMINRLLDAARSEGLQPVSVKGEDVQIRGGSGAQERPSRRAPTDCQTSRDGQ